MPLLNYTTAIKVEQTTSEIQKILMNAGAKRMAVEFEDGEPVGVAFQIEVDGQMHSFQLPVNVEGALSVLQTQKKTNANVAKAGANRPQAARVAWRILKDWLEAQLALIALKQATLEQIMLPYLLVAPDVTLYDTMKRAHFALPPKTET